MGPEEIRRLLIALLESSGAAWEQADGWICFRLSKDGAVWDMACRCLTGRMLAYGRPAAAGGGPGRSLPPVQPGSTAR